MYMQFIIIFTQDFIEWLDIYETLGNAPLTFYEVNMKYMDYTYNFAMFRHVGCQL